MKHLPALARHMAAEIHLFRRNRPRYALLRDVEDRLLRLEAEAIRTLESIRKARRSGDSARSRRAFTRLLALDEEPRFLFELLNEPDPRGQLFLTSSYFLTACHAFLTAHPSGHERLHFVTGMKLGRALALDQMVGLRQVEDSPIYARADEGSVRRGLLRMEALGHSLQGLFHAHPGRGPSATRPSGTDLATHERYERGGHVLVGAIFTKDGHVRFFTHRAEFHVAIFGQGAKRIDENIYLLEEAKTDQDRTA